MIKLFLKARFLQLVSSDFFVFSCIVFVIIGLNEGKFVILINIKYNLKNKNRCWEAPIIF